MLTKNVTALALAFLVFATTTLAEKPSLTPQAIQQRAIDLMDEADKANKKELRLLWDKVQTHFQAMDADQKMTFLGKVRARLLADRESLAKVRATLKERQSGAVDLTTSLGKLIGNKDHTGILEDAQALIPESKEDNLLYRPYDSLKPENNRITVLKTLLFYAWAEAEMATSVEKLPGAQEVAQFQYVYPASIPEGMDADFQGTTLYCPNTKKVMVMNAGFIFGGDRIDGVCRGLDCSAYQSYCTASSKRLSTQIMEFAWRELHDGIASFTKSDMETRKKIYPWGLKEALAEFEAIDPIKEKLLPGDIVIWRTPVIDSKSGHTVMYLGPSDTEDEFRGIEVNRFDDKSIEGFSIRNFTLAKANYSTYVLRRKE